MNILKHYIKEIYYEILFYYNGMPYYKVKMLIDCWGSKEIKEKVLDKQTWENYKKQGYYEE